MKIKKASTLIELIKINTITDDAFLYVAQFKDHIPFLVRRIFTISQPKDGEPRGFHAHKKNQQLLFCLQGKVKMILDNGRVKETTVLEDPGIGILLRPMVWHEMHEMTSKTTLLILASRRYNPGDYIRSYEQFKRLVSKTK
jgi:dTDP-4-dehydrorhamnose 3,5-epimerase-like enzyme